MANKPAKPAPKRTTVDGSGATAVSVKPPVPEIVPDPEEINAEKSPPTLLNVRVIEPSPVLNGLKSYVGRLLLVTPVTVPLRSRKPTEVDRPLVRL